MRLTLTPAYGRDYRSRAAVLEAWQAGSDFVIASFGPDSGRYVNREDLVGKPTTLNIYYGKLRKVTVIEWKG